MGYLTILGTLKILIVLREDFLIGYFIRNNSEYILNNCLQGLHMFYSLASDVKSFCISVSLLGSFSLVFYPQPSHPSCLSMW